MTPRDRADVMAALDNWFTSQDIDVSDRVYICTQMAGLYFSCLASANVKMNSPTEFARGLNLLEKIMKQAALAARVE